MRKDRLSFRLTPRAPRTYLATLAIQCSVPAAMPEGMTAFGNFQGSLWAHKSLWRVPACATSKTFAIPIVRLVPGSRSVVIVLALVTNCTNDDGAVIDYFK